MNTDWKLLTLSAGAVLACLPAARAAETCTPQSQMQPAERTDLAAAAESLAAKIQANNTAGVRSSTIAEFQNNFGGMSQTITATADKLKGATPEVEEIYILDASSLKVGADGVNPDAQFFCTLNKSANEAEFSIPQLPPGKYAFAMVRMENASPWRLSFLMRQDGGKWLLAGLYPKPLTADGHDGLWYWKQARDLETQNAPWAAWFYLQQAQSLVIPAGFVSSTHLDKLQSELQTATPSAVGNGVSADAPLVVKGPAGAEYHFTSLSLDDTLGLDIVAHFKVDSLEAATARKRNIDAMQALLTAHPELRKSFHGMWFFADAPGQAPFGTEVAMADVH